MKVNPTAKRVLIALVLVAVVIGGAHALTDGTNVTGEIPINASDGPLVVVDFDNGGELNLKDPDPDNDNKTVVVTTSDAETTFFSDGPTNVTVADDEINGTWTNVTNLAVADNELSINPNDKQRVNVSGNADTLSFKDVEVDSNEADFFYSGSGGTTNVTIHDIDETDVKLGAIDTDTGDVLATTLPHDNGTAQFEGLPNSIFGVEVEIVPWEMRVFNESAPEMIIDDRQITAEFFDLDGDEVVTETTSNGTIPFDNLTDSTWAVSLSTTDYADRQVILKDIFDQRDVWLLNESDPAISIVEPTYLVEDETGQFDPTSSRVYIQRALEIGGSTQYRTIAAEEVGTDGYTETLESAERYRIIVENTDGDRRVLGKFSADSSGDFVLTVEEIVYDLGREDDAISWSFNHSVLNEGEPSETQSVTFAFKDEDDRTRDLEVVIFERGNRSNELHNETYAGPFGEIVITEPIDASEHNNEWAVEWTAERNPTFSGRTVVGPRGVLDVPLDDTWKHVISVGLILTVAGLGSQVNAPAVGIAVAGVGGILYYIGFMPAAVTGGVIAVGFLIPALYIIQQQRGGV